MPTAKFEFIDRYNAVGSLTRTFTNRYDVDVTAAKAALTYTPSAGCPGKTAPPSGAFYSAGVQKDGKRYLLLTLPYGKSGSARYRFVQP